MYHFGYYYYPLLENRKWKHILFYILCLPAPYSQQPHQSFSPHPASCCNSINELDHAPLYNLKSSRLRTWFPISLNFSSFRNVFPCLHPSCAQLMGTSMHNNVIFVSRNHELFGDWYCLYVQLTNWDQLSLASSMGPASVELLAAGLDGYVNQGKRVEELLDKIWPPPNV